METVLPLGESSARISRKRCWDKSHERKDGFELCGAEKTRGEVTKCEGGGRSQKGRTELKTDTDPMQPQLVMTSLSCQGFEGEKS